MRIKPEVLPDIIVGNTYTVVDAPEGKKGSHHSLVRFSIVTVLNMEGSDSNSVYYKCADAYDNISYLYDYELQ